MTGEDCDRRGPGGECCRDHEPCPDFPAPVTGETTDGREAEGLTDAERSWGITREHGTTVYAERDVERILAARVTAAATRAADDRAERIAQAIEAGVLPSHPNSGYVDGFRRAANIARTTP